MRRKILTPIIQHVIRVGFIVMGIIWMVSCNEDYFYDEKEPEWLGESIYDYLKSDGNFTFFIRLIDVVQYTSVLSKTGSKTIFVAKDDAFERFLTNNSWGVTSYEALTLEQKKLILNFSMINNAYLIETLSNYNNGGLQSGTALRRTSSISVLDHLSVKSGTDLPDNPWWDAYRNKGIYLLEDATEWPIVHFLQSSLDNAGISNSDFSLLTGVERAENDAHIFNIKIIERDITCKNGYIHVLENVLTPPQNVAAYLHENPSTQIFSKLLEKFSAPYFNQTLTNEYNKNHPTEKIDSIFENIFFSYNGGTNRYPNGRPIGDNMLLPFNPGKNNYSPAGSALQADFSAILAPTDDAMSNYLEEGSGIIIKERYGSWENVPSDIAVKFLQRHLRGSFLESVPGRFDKMNDSKNSPLNAKLSDVSSAYVGLNGVVYQTNKVYPPDDYVSVYAPVLFSDKTKVFDWAVEQNDFDLYLNALESMYSFFVPTDLYFENYIDPIAYAKDVKAVLKYWYNSETGTVNATVYGYDPVTGTVGDSLDVIDNSSFLTNRLLDLLDSYIVIGDVESGSQYYFTKNGNSIKVSGSGLNLKVQAGEDIKKGVVANVVSNGYFKQQNGNTYFLDKPLQMPLQSVYKVLSETPEFSEFFKLLTEFTGTTSEIFVKKTNYYGIDFNIKFFNTFNYTVYVPTNEAIQKAIADSVIHDWNYINAIIDLDLKDMEIKKLERFLRYHFQDNSVYISGDAVNAVYQTATIKTNDLNTKFGTYKDKYYRIGITGNGNTLELSTEDYGSAAVVTTSGLYNIMARDYIFSDNPQAYSEIDKTGVGKDFTSSSITTSSTAVIHQIDNILRFE